MEIQDLKEKVVKLTTVIRQMEMQKAELVQQVKLQVSDCWGKKDFMNMCQIHNNIPIAPFLLCWENMPCLDTKPMHQYDTEYGICRKRKTCYKYMYSLYTKIIELRI